MMQVENAWRNAVCGDAGFKFSGTPLCGRGGASRLDVVRSRKLDIHELPQATTTVIESCDHDRGGG